jgi:hypothetical protein
MEINPCSMHGTAKLCAYQSRMQDEILEPLDGDSPQNTKQLKSHTELDSDTK